MREGPKRFVALGECMVELQEREPGVMTRTFGGDTLNTAVYMARRLTPGVAEIDYVTALGDDPFSEEMLAAWRNEGVGTALVARLPGRLPGLYVISTDGGGERSFHYWRSAAAARELFRCPLGETLGERLAGYDLVYLTGVSLGVLPPKDRERLFAALAKVRAGGGRVAVDSNYRPGIWPDAADAAAWMHRLLGHCDIALPTFGDEAALFGAHDAPAAAAHLHRLGVGEVVVKQGAAPAVLSLAGAVTEVSAVPVAAVVDTTAAGDAFNAGYLAARLLGLAPPAAVRQAHTLAALVIQYRGAIIPRAAMAEA